MVLRLEVGDEVFPTMLQQEAGRGERGDRQQADTEDANSDLLWWSGDYNLMIEARGKFPATARRRVRHEIAGCT